MPGQAGSPPQEKTASQKGCMGAGSLEGHVRPIPGSDSGPWGMYCLIWLGLGAVLGIWISMRGALYAEGKEGFLGEREALWKRREERISETSTGTYQKYNLLSDK